ncbi:MAG: histidine phosphatase family protein [Pseudomonadota bacterium]
MTRTLILIRHAKSGWDDPNLHDHARPLHPSGIRTAAAIGRWLRTGGWTCDQAISSDAARTRATWEGIESEWRTGIVCAFTPTLYHADPQAMMTVLTGCALPTVVMVGHNPGIGEFARRLAAGPSGGDRFRTYPTGATTIFRFDADRWTDIGRSGGTVLDFVVPRAPEDVKKVPGRGADRPQ